ncbi:toll/interleukin-1 receptor domain-containing protein [Shewanella sp. MM_2022_3]|uniref:toll/interleukin-1 receptor domain-containing protein n=1 Tax=Shewanella sp. MM_2022_3 TaxID=2923280 RepID=UPI001F4BD4F7|nr:toll/interleukin-1 receptor domain-containing protein [Shewanella sp. MM_2022_3]MCH7421924.1 toll/interleukin-1 receptor domain-containing protein [Shewanella sp. MM_2022_3]
MSKIFISHSNKDKGLHDALRDALIEIGHDVIGMDSLSVGSNIAKDLNKLLHSADAVVAILTDESLKSRHVINEITVALAQMDAVDSKLFIPIVVGENIAIPDYLLDRFVQMVPNFMDSYLNKVVSSIHRAIERNKAVQEEKKRAKTAQAAKLETSKTEFIREAEERLNTKESSLKLSANFWYGLGYAALILGVLATFYLIKESLGKDISTGAIVLLSIKGLIGIGLLVASSKYAFTLGKSYMNESLKNSDRLHAISFGKFYLQAYGDVVTPEDVKEVFQHWNIAQNSSFKDIDSKNFDPRILESAIEIASVLKKNDTSSKKNT